MGCEESDTTERLHFHFSLSCIGEGNGNPLQCSCLENPRDGGAWWAAVYGVAQSQIRLKQFSSSSRGHIFFIFCMVIQYKFELWRVYSDNRTIEMFPIFKIHHSFMVIFCSHGGRYSADCMLKSNNEHVLPITNMKFEALFNTKNHLQYFKIWYTPIHLLLLILWGCSSNLGNCSYFCPKLLLFIKHI